MFFCSSKKIIDFFSVLVAKSAINCKKKEYDIWPTKHTDAFCAFLSDIIFLSLCLVFPPNMFKQCIEVSVTQRLQVFKPIT